MARGGYRPGAGRPKGTKAPVAKPEKALETTKDQADIRKAARRLRLSPLQYMLAVMNDETADDARRDRMAVAAAPYTHPKAEAVKPGKKEQAATAAQTAEQGTDWEGLLN